MRIVHACKRAAIDVWEELEGARPSSARASLACGGLSIPETSSHPMWSRDRPPEKLRARKNPWPERHMRRLGHSSLARRTHCSGSRHPRHGEVTPLAARTDDADRQRLVGVKASIAPSIVWARRMESRNLSHRGSRRLQQLLPAPRVSSTVGRNGPAGVREQGMSTEVPPERRPGRLRCREVAVPR
jgi:hypothetical protein